MITMPTRPLRILVVDDDPAMVGAVTALVGTEGHQVGMLLAEALDGGEPVVGGDDLVALGAD